MTAAELEIARQLLCQLGDEIRNQITSARDRGLTKNFADVAAETAADTIYGIDKLSEEPILTWFEKKWPPEWPVELIMEGIDETSAPVFPKKSPPEKIQFTCIVDPIDGTRGLMYDKRSAWALAALAPRGKKRPRLSDLTVAAMTEIPTSKQTISDQISGIAGRGRDGIVSERRDPVSRKIEKLLLRPSTATDFQHGFASLCKFFPEGRTLTSQIEERLWRELGKLDASTSPVIFDDQYISTGGQIYEILVGHDRMIGDLRPLILPKAGFPSSLACHPYDICTGFLLNEAGAILESPDGKSIDAPLDTTSPVSWIAYANPILAGKIRPILQQILTEILE